jgi:2-oxoglutarate/2-oxoacid ferredoxin oxidoreductase subunit beta
MNYKPDNFNTLVPPTLCPGCGGWTIWSALKQALAEQGIQTKDLVLVYGIGCFGNMTNSIKGYVFHSLHGRSLPIATGIKLANSKLKVIAIAGDGDVYGEGLNHLINSSRANIDIIQIVANNHSYSLTTGQASPTSSLGYKSRTTPLGEVKEPLNPLALSLESGATLVAQGYTGNLKELTQIFKEALNHKGFSLIDIQQVCITFNHTENASYYAEKVKPLIKANTDIELALKYARDKKNINTGVLYEVNRPIYDSHFNHLGNKTLLEQVTSPNSQLMKSFIKELSI